LLKKPYRQPRKKKPRKLKKKQLDELKHEIEMVIFFFIICVLNVLVIVDQL